MYLWKHKLWNYEVKIFILSVDIDPDGATKSRYFSTLKLL